MLKDFVQDLQDDRELNLKLMRLYRAVRDKEPGEIHEAMERCNNLISEQEGRRHE